MQAFGGYKGLKSFVDRANSLGIGVMLDIVSHTHCTPRTCHCSTCTH